MFAAAIMMASSAVAHADQIDYTRPKAATAWRRSSSSALSRPRRRWTPTRSRCLPARSAAPMCNSAPIIRHFI